MTDELYVLRDVDTRLDQAGIAYMLTGSMAMHYYAEPRMTRDLDIVAELTRDDVSTIVDAFSDGYYIDPDDVRESVQRRSIFNVIERRRVVKVDFIVRKDTAYRKREFALRRRIDANGFQIWIVSKEDLILSKLDWAKDSRSAFQLRDIRNLMRAGYDREYVESWVETLGLTGIYDEACDG